MANEPIFIAVWECYLDNDKDHKDRYFEGMTTDGSFWRYYPNRKPVSWIFTVKPKFDKFNSDEL